MTWNVTNIANKTELSEILVGTALAFPDLMPILLSFQYAIILISGMSYQSNRLGQSNFAMWSSISSFITLVTALFWSGVSATFNGTDFSLIQTSTLIVCFVVFLVSTISYLIFHND